MALDALAADLLALLEGPADPAPADLKPAPVRVPDRPSEPIPAAAPKRAPEPMQAKASKAGRHCACGSPSWWRSPDGWRCAYCAPRPASFTGLALALAGGQWAPGCAPPMPPTVTAADLLELHGPTVAGCRLVDVLAEADDTDLPDLLGADTLAGFARALVADRRVRPLPPTDLPPLARLAAELGDEPGELREYLDRTGPGRAVHARLEREAGACDRCLLALRADPAGGLLPLLLQALDAETRNARTER